MELWLDRLRVKKLNKFGSIYMITLYEFYIPPQQSTQYLQPVYYNNYQSLYQPQPNMYYQPQLNNMYYQPIPPISYNNYQQSQNNAQFMYPNYQQPIQQQPVQQPIQQQSTQQPNNTPQVSIQPNNNEQMKTSDVSVVNNVKKYGNVALGAGAGAAAAGGFGLLAS